MASQTIHLINATVTCNDMPASDVPADAQCVRCNRRLNRAVLTTSDANPTLELWTCGPCAFSMFGFRSDLK